jgi:hypothetical protein
MLRGICWLWVELKYVRWRRIAGLCFGFGLWYTRYLWEVIK